MDLREIVKVSPQYFDKMDYFQKCTDIHSLLTYWLCHRSLQSTEGILSHVGSEDDLRDHLPRSSRCPCCGTAAPEHQFSSVVAHHIEGRSDTLKQRQFGFF